MHARTKGRRRGRARCTGQQPHLVGPPFFWFGKLKIGNCWRWLLFNLVNYYSNLLKHNIWQVRYTKLLEMLLWVWIWIRVVVLIQARFSPLHFTCRFGKSLEYRFGRDWVWLVAFIWYTWFSCMWFCFGLDLISRSGFVHCWVQVVSCACGIWYLELSSVYSEGIGYHYKEQRS